MQPVGVRDLVKKSDAFSMGRVLLGLAHVPSLGLKYLRAVTHVAARFFLHSESAFRKLVR